MLPADVSDCADAWRDADLDLRPRMNLPVRRWTEETDARTHRQIRHFLATDPAGSWVADVEGRVAGLAQSYRREGVWVLAHFFVNPWAQGRGVGRALLECSLAYGAPDEPGYIASSPDPRALRRYARAGFDLHPTAIGWGPVRRAGLRRASHVRDGHGADVGLACDVDRRVRGAARAVDLQHCLDEDDRMLVVEGKGYALVRENRVVLVAALDEETATDLLVAGLAEIPDGAVAEVNRMTAAQQWAIRGSLDAGLEIHMHGAVFVRGRPSPPAPYLPHGALA